MNIEFIKIEMQNFKSIGELVELDYKKLNGLDFVYGKNNDVANARNGSGKCLHPDTNVNIEILDEDVKNKFLNFLKNNKC